MIPVEEHKGSVPGRRCSHRGQAPVWSAWLTTKTRSIRPHNTVSTTTASPRCLSLRRPLRSACHRHTVCRRITGCRAQCAQSLQARLLRRATHHARALRLQTRPHEAGGRAERGGRAREARRARFLSEGCSPTWGNGRSGCSPHLGKALCVCSPY